MRAAATDPAPPLLAYGPASSVSTPMRTGAACARACPANIAAPARTARRPTPCAPIDAPPVPASYPFSAAGTEANPRNRARIPRTGGPARA